MEGIVFSAWGIFMPKAESFVTAITSLNIIYMYNSMSYFKNRQVSSYIFLPFYTYRMFLEAESYAEQYGYAEDEELNI